MDLAFVNRWFYYQLDKTPPLSLLRERHPLGWGEEQGCNGRKAYSGNHQNAHFCLTCKMVKLSNCHHFNRYLAPVKYQAQGFVGGCEDLTSPAAHHVHPPE